MQLGAAMKSQDPLFFHWGMLETQTLPKTTQYADSD